MKISDTNKEGGVRLPSISRRLLLTLTILFFLGASATAFSSSLSHSPVRTASHFASISDTPSSVVPVSPIVIFPKTPDVPGDPLPPSAVKETVKSTKTIVFDRVSGSSSLTYRELRLVMAGGRVFDPVTRTWSVRPLMTGLQKSNLFSSWLGKRDRVNGSVPDGFPLYSSN